MTTLIVAYKIVLTLIITGALTAALAVYVAPPERTSVLKWYQLVVGFLIILHAIVFPVSLINLVWSF